MTDQFDIPGRCTMPTSTARQCRRVAVVQYLDGTRQVAAYCRQHDAWKGGRAQLLHIMPWEYTERREVADYFPGTAVKRGPFGPRDTRKRSLYAPEGI